MEKNECTFCRILELDKKGNETHSDMKKFDHEFISGIKTEKHEAKERRNLILKYSGVGLVGIAAMASILNLII